MEKILALEKQLESLQAAAIEIALEIGKYQDEGLCVRISDTGRSVFTTRPFQKGDFICYYEGDLVTRMEGTRRSQSLSPYAPCFMFFFKKFDKQWCIDATKESFTFGRLINHSKSKANIKPFSGFVKDRICVEFRAICHIPPNVEIFYDYGERDSATILANPWLRE